MNRKRLALALCFGLVLSGSAVFFLSQSTGSAINEDNFERIAKGMTRQQVEEILGGSPRDETNGFFGPRRVVASSWSWTSSEGDILVFYAIVGPDRIVYSKEFYRPAQPSWLIRLRALLGL